jgi:Lon protease-like protein
MSEAFSPLANFSGMARLFPLPNLVFFPHVLQPLHIFEPRYQQMTADALCGDRLIALVLPRPGWEAEYSGSPALHAVGALGKIVADQQVEDGRYNILLRGLSRVRIEHELPHSKLYRKAKVELLEDAPVTDAKRQRDLRRKVRKMLSVWFADLPELQAQFRKLLEGELPLGGLADILAFARPLDVAFKQELLEELRVETRLERLLSAPGPNPASTSAPPRTFPPEFSAN